MSQNISLLGQACFVANFTIIIEIILHMLLFLKSGVDLFWILKCLFDNL